MPGLRRFPGPVDVLGIALEIVIHRDVGDAGEILPELIHQLPLDHWEKLSGVVRFSLRDILLVIFLDSRHAIQLSCDWKNFQWSFADLR